METAGEEESNPCVSPHPMTYYLRVAALGGQRHPPDCARGKKWKGPQPAQHHRRSAGLEALTIKKTKMNPPERRNPTPVCLHTP